MTKMKLALVLCGCLIGGVAAAAPKWDANGDGTISAQEKAQRHEQMNAKREEMKTKMLAKCDTNKLAELYKSDGTSGGPWSRLGSAKTPSWVSPL